MNVDKNLEAKTVVKDGYKWINVLQPCFKIYGFNWINEDKRFNRLPKSMDEEVIKVSPKVSFLATNTSGGQIHFRTNTRKLAIHVKLKSSVCVSGMSAVGQCGFDCYVGKTYDDLHFYGASCYDISLMEYTVTLFNTYSHDDKVVVVNMPLYAAVEDVEFGFEESSYVLPSNFKNDGKNRVVLYGTSITQGGCANRPGLSYSNILSRKFQREFLNFGFSGNAFGEKLIASIIGQIKNVDLIYINFEANGGTNGLMEKNLEEFITTIRKYQKDVPIIICSRIIYLFDTVVESLGHRREELRMFQVNLVKKFQELGDKNIYYLDGRTLLGEDFYEYTTDTIHPNDAGFLKIASVLAKEFEKFIK